MSEKESKNWSLFFTTFRGEERAKVQLDAAGIPNYLPMKTSRILWRNVPKEGSIPAISRCIFVCFSDEELGNLTSITSLLPPAVDISRCSLSAQQMENVRILFREGHPPVATVLPDGISRTKVRVVSGDFEGLTGELLQVADDCKIMIRINEVMSLSIDITPDLLEGV